MLLLLLGASLLLNLLLLWQTRRHRRANKKLAHGLSQLLLSRPARRRAQTKAEMLLQRSVPPS